MPKILNQTAQDIQDDIFRKMSVEQKLQLTWDFSKHIKKSGENIDMNYLKWWLNRNMEESNLNRAYKV